MSLLNLIKKDHRVGIPAHLFAELAALLVAYIAWRGADHLGNAMLFHIFRHVYPDQSRLCAEHGLGQGLGKLRLSHTGRA